MRTQKGIVDKLLFNTKRHLYVYQRPTVVLVIRLTKTLGFTDYCVNLLNRQNHIRQND